MLLLQSLFNNMLNLCATVEGRKISWKFSKSETSVSASFSPSFKSLRRAIDRQPSQSQNLFQQQADTLWEIKHGGMLSL